MKVLVRDKEYKITFSVGKWSGNFYNGIVICTIKRKSDVLSEVFGYPFWVNYAGGFALCVHTDGFNRAEGRRIALTRALRTFSREDRTDIWKKFHETYKEPE